MPSPAKRPSQDQELGEGQTGSLSTLEVLAPANACVAAPNGIQKKLLFTERTHRRAGLAADSLCDLWKSTLPL